MDIKSKQERSINMSHIKSKDTKVEVFIRSTLFKERYRFRVNYKMVVGSPDIFFSKKKVAVFVHGCYWHRHNGCKFAYIPHSNEEFWERKFNENVARDKNAIQKLIENKIRVLVIWECTIEKMKTDSTFCAMQVSIIKQFIDFDTDFYREI